jgi:hypothetical protein
MCALVPPAPDQPSIASAVPRTRRRTPLVMSAQALALPELAHRLTGLALQDLPSEQESHYERQTETLPLISLDATSAVKRINCVY